MNYMPEVAKMLGVEIGEEFEIVFPDNLNCHATAILNNGRLFIKDHNLANQDMWQQSALTNILNGNYKIKRKPWKPNIDDMYYYVDELGCICFDPWVNDALDLMFYKLGNCYKTKEDAEKDKDKWIAFYKSDEVLEA